MANRASVEGRQMDKKFRDYNPDQPYLLPPSPKDWLPDDHLVHFIADVVEVFDLKAIFASYRSRSGRPPYHPRLMVGLWLYAYCVGVRSSRKLEKAAYEDIAFRYLAGDQQPDHWTLSEFRRRHSKALGELFVQTVKLAAHAGLVKLGHVAIDGTKIKANASKHKAMSYKRMVEEERRIRTEIEEYFKDVDAADNEENLRHGDRRGDELPEHLQSALKRLKAIQDAKKALEEEARERCRAEQEERRKKAEAEGRQYHPRKDAEEAVPSPKAQRNFTDPESRIMPNSDKAFNQSYNGQIAVDAETQVIVAAELTNQSADAPHLPSLIDQVAENTGSYPEELSGDAGYWSEANIEKLEECGVEAFIPAQRVHHSTWRKMGSPKGRIPRNATKAQLMMRKLFTKRGRARYALRQQSVEPVFGQTKEARGLRQFLHRGREKNEAMWLLDCAAHNILKIFRAGFKLKY